MFFFRYKLQKSNQTGIFKQNVVWAKSWYRYWREKEKTEGESVDKQQHQIFSQNIWTASSLWWDFQKQ